MRCGIGRCCLPGGRYSWKPSPPLGQSLEQEPAPGLPGAPQAQPLAALFSQLCSGLMLLLLLLTRVMGGVRSWGVREMQHRWGAQPHGGVPCPRCACTFLLSPCSGTGGRQAGKVRFVHPPFRVGCLCGHVTRTPGSEAGLEAGVASRPVPNPAALSTLLLSLDGSCSFTQLPSAAFSRNREHEARAPDSALFAPLCGSGIHLWVVYLSTDCLLSTDACLVLWEMPEQQTRER